MSTGFRQSMFNMIKRTRDSVISGERKKDIITEDFKGNGYILGLKVHGSYMGDGIHHYPWYDRTYKICACTIYTHVYCVCTIYTRTAYMFTYSR